MAAMDAFSSLQREVEIVKEGLKNVDENIKKLTGRDPSEMSTQRGPVGNRRVTLKRNFADRITGPAPKRFNTGGAYNRPNSRLSSSNRDQHSSQLESDGEEEEDEDQKPALQSTVVATPAPSRLKQDSTPDKKTQTRNKRMFGVLLGTLQKFKETSSREAARERRRHEIEKKLEVAAEKEKEEVIRQKKELFYSRREKQTQLENLEKRMEVAEMMDDWELHDRQVNKFIKTKSKPHIYYLPAKHNNATESLLKETTKAAEEAINERRKEVEEFLRKPVNENSKKAMEDDDGMQTLQRAEGDNERVDEGPVEVEGRVGDDVEHVEVLEKTGVDEGQMEEKETDDNERCVEINSKEGDDVEHARTDSKTDDKRTENVDRVESDKDEEVKDSESNEKVENVGDEQSGQMSVVAEQEDDGIANEEKGVGDEMKEDKIGNEKVVCQTTEFAKSGEEVQTYDEHSTADSMVEGSVDQ